MKNKIKNIFLLSILVFLISTRSLAQSKQDSWPHIPGITSEILAKKEPFYIVMGLAALTYSLSEFVFKDSLNMNFYQPRIGMNNEHYWGLRKVFQENFGLEKRVAPGFAIAAEFNMQQWVDQTPNIESKNKLGFGTGLMTYYRWYLLGKKSFSPYFEYGAGLFFGLKRFPYNGSKFTFNHTVQLGFEYTFENKDKVRLGYGLFHQSNANLSQPNARYNADGFNITYSWFWKNTKW